MLQNIVQEIFRCNILPDSYREWSVLKGGTNSQVGVISSSVSPMKYVVKMNNPEQIASESEFYNLYRTISLLPKTVYVDPEYRFLLYHYVPGETSSYVRGSKATLMNDLIQQVIRHYIVPASSQKNHGWIEDPMRVKDDIVYAKSIITTHLSLDDHRLVEQIHARRSGRLESKRLFVLHGDFGVHNFLFDSGRLSGVIDPIPCLGRPLYDLLYAFCSSPDDLYLSVLTSAVEQMRNEEIHQSDLIDDMIIALYMRLCTCLHHHPHDLPAYLRAWSEWVDLFAPSS